MSGPTCRDLAADVAAYLDGDLELRRLENVERHLATCRTCQTCAEELRATIELIRREAFQPMDAATCQRAKSRLWDAIRS